MSVRNCEFNYRGLNEHILATHFPVLLFQITLGVPLIPELGSHILKEEESALMSGWFCKN